MTHFKTTITAARIEAHIASALRMLLWLFGAILRGGLSGRGASLKRLLSRAEYAVERLVFLKAVAARGPLPSRRLYPRFAPSGFRRVESRRLRLFFRGAGIRARKAGALARVSALVEALAHPDRAIAYFLKRIANGLRLGRLVLVAPVAPRESGIEGVVPAALSDTS